MEAPYRTTPRDEELLRVRRSLAEARVVAALLALLALVDTALLARLLLG